MNLLSVLIVNFNGARHLPRLVRALEEQTLPRHRWEVVVVDNASADGSANLLPSWMRVVRLAKNVGFAEGNNVARRHAHGNYLVLLNNDTVPDPYWLEELERVRAANPGACVASKLVFDADPHTVNSGGLYLLRDGRGADAGFREPDGGQYERERDVFAGCGAAVGMPAGGDVLDGRYFMYYEDLDAGWAAQAHGRRTIFAPRSLVRHVHGGAAGDQSPLFRFHVERNRALTNLRRADAFLALGSMLVLLAKVPQAWLRVLLRKQPAAQGWAVSHALVSFALRFPRTLAERYAERSACA